MGIGAMLLLTGKFQRMRVPHRIVVRHDKVSTSIKLFATGLARGQIQNDAIKHQRQTNIFAGEEDGV